MVGEIEYAMPFALPSCPCRVCGNSVQSLFLRKVAPRFSQSKSTP